MHRGSLVSTLGFLSACAGYQPTPTSDSFPAHFEAALKDLEKRVAFDLDCPAQEVSYRDLGSTTGVSGCGKKAAYKWVPGAGWVLNSETAEK